MSTSQKIIALCVIAGFLLIGSAWAWRDKPTSVEKVSSEQYVGKVKCTYGCMRFLPTVAAPGWGVSVGGGQKYTPSMCSGKQDALIEATKYLVVYESGDVRTRVKKKIIEKHGKCE